MNKIYTSSASFLSSSSSSSSSFSSFLSSAVFLLFFLRILHLTQLLPLLGKSISVGNIVRDNHVVENGSCLTLPQVKAHKTKVIKLVDAVIVHIFGVGDLLGLPDALVCRIRYTLAVPITLVCSVVFHWRFPF